MNKKLFLKPLIIPLLSAIVVIFAYKMIFSQQENSVPPLTEQTQKETPPAQTPKYVRGIHLTAWVAGSKKLRAKFEKLIDETELNCTVIDIKEYEGQIYVPGYKPADTYKATLNAIPDIKTYLEHLKSKGIYTVARIVVFKDDIAPRKNPAMAVKTSTGELWKDRKGLTWLDPYNKDAWEYNIGLAEHAADLGFEEVQFDYIRFPSDGQTKGCRYSQKHSSLTASVALVDFLKLANERLRKKGINTSIDVFGLTTTVTNGMGIGQKMVEMSEHIDFVCPMVYPSHYAKDEYGIANPNLNPYKTVYISIKGAKKGMGKNSIKLRPWLQDFSLGAHYGPKQVRAQIQACYDNGVGDWLLWNPRCVYTQGALKDKEEENKYEKLSSTQAAVELYPASKESTPKQKMISSSETVKTTQSAVAQEVSLSTKTTETQEIKKSTGITTVKKSKSTKTKTSKKKPAAKTKKSSK
ncbi:MAG: putative glycoside hydrolase [Endomicrobiales bacterium]|nr:putative glycoside hydrolase [Endomicrobiales bacterium]